MATATVVAAVAPPEIALVRDFVNTVEWQVDDETWKTPAELAAWLSEHTGRPQLALRNADLALARRIREGLRGILLMHAGHDPLATSVDDLNDALALLPLRMSFNDDGDVTLSPARAGDRAAHSGLAEALAPILGAINAARRNGSWMRLKACSRESCRWAYWDASRNRSGRWCSMTGCGNYIKMRRRNSPHPMDGDVIGDRVGRTRPPTMLDVAARAGVSIKTVSNVVTGTVYVSENTRARVQSAIVELGFHPNLVARALRTGRDLLH